MILINWSAASCSVCMSADLVAFFSFKEYEASQLLVYENMVYF